MNCPGCKSANTIGPFEMDGIKNGVYKLRGYWWLWCHSCKRTASVDAPTTHEVHP